MIARSVAAFVGVWALALAPGCREPLPATKAPRRLDAPAQTAAAGGPALAAPAGPRPHEVDRAFAADLETLHRVFANRLARPHAAPGHLQAHADAVELAGASWALVDGAPRYLRAANPGPVLWPQGRLPHDGREPPDVEPAGAGLDALWQAAMATGAPQRLRDAAGHTHLRPIVNDVDCRGCHAREAGAVLGAYVYRLEEISDD